jgi:subtilisin family serine protease
MKIVARTANTILSLALLITGMLIPESSVLTPSVKAQSQTESAQVNYPFVPGRVLVKFRSDVTRSRSRRVITRAGSSDAGEISGIGVHLVELPAAADEAAFVNVFKSQPEVEFAELDRIVMPETMTPNDPSYPNQWHLPRISAPSAWSGTTGSGSVIIAICDTGVDPTHPDLTTKLVPGWNFYDNNSDTHDVYGHGTAVAGTAAESSNNGLGMASVAWGCEIMPLRVSAPDGSASYSTITNAITWAADHGARVANVSYIVSNSSAVSSAGHYLQSHGGVLAVSAGNYATFDSSPDNPNMLVVSATDRNDVLATWSNTGNNVDLSAPGVDIGTTTNGGTFGYGSGTSFSAPIVAGVAALVISANPSLSASQVTAVLKQSADDLGSPGWDPSYGAGRVNADRAVSLAAGITPPPSDTAPPSVSITSPSGGSSVSGTISVQGSASDNVGVTSVSLSIDGVALGSDTTVPYSFSWNTTTVANGSHNLTATASDAAGNTASTTITVTVSNLADTTAPVISITSPANGARVTGNLSVLVQATDNVRVTRVELYVDGTLTATSTSAPFTTKWNTKRAASGGHVLQCKAYDAVGNSGASSVLTVYK